MYERPLVYVAGPYRLPDPVYNTNRACRVGMELCSTGLVSVLVPHTTMLFHAIAPAPEEFWLALDLAHLRRCDALYRYTMDVSHGADNEERMAEEWGIPCFRDQHQLLTWAEGRHAVS